MQNRYVIIIPTHRPEMLDKLIQSILLQKELPEAIYIIDDTRPKNENLLFSIPKLEPILHVIDSNYLLGTGPVNAFKNCFKIAKFDQDTHLDTNNFYHIMEDDTTFIRTKAIKVYKNLIKEYKYDFIYSPIIDIEDTKILNGNLKLRSEPIFQDGIPEDILDTCSIIFSGEFIESFNLYLKNKEYALNGDMFFYSWFKCTSVNSIQLTETFISSAIHNNQVNSNLYLQTLDTQYNWYDSFKKLCYSMNLIKPNRKLFKQLKLETRLQINYALRAAIDYYKIDLTNIEPTKPTRSTLRKIKQFHYKGIINCEFSYVSFLKSNRSSLKWLLQISLHPKDLDFHPNLKHLLELK